MYLYTGFLSFFPNAKEFRHGLKHMSVKDRHAEGYTPLDIHLTRDDFDVVTGEVMPKTVFAFRHCVALNKTILDINCQK